MGRQNTAPGDVSSRIGTYFFSPFLLLCRNSTWKSDLTEPKDNPCNLAALPTAGRHPSSSRGKAGLLFPYAPETESPRTAGCRCWIIPFQVMAAGSAPVLPGQG